MALTRPELSEPSFLPVDDCAWLGNDQDLPPPIRDPRKENPEKRTQKREPRKENPEKRTQKREPRKENPEKPIRVRELRPFRGSIQNRQLLTQRQVLQS
jgi:hypothetical protein